MPRTTCPLIVALSRDSSFLTRCFFREAGRVASFPMPSAGEGSMRLFYRAPAGPSTYSQALFVSLIRLPLPPHAGQVSVAPHSPTSGSPPSGRVHASGRPGRPVSPTRTPGACFVLPFPGRVHPPVFRQVVLAPGITHAAPYILCGSPCPVLAHASIGVRVCLRSPYDLWKPERLKRGSAGSPAPYALRKSKAGRRRPPIRGRPRASPSPPSLPSCACRAPCNLASIALGTRRMLSLRALACAEVATHAGCA